MASFQIQLQESTGEIGNKILAEMGRVLDKTVNSVTGTIKSDVKTALENAITSTPHWDSLLRGTLRGHFGLPANTIQSRLQIILDTLVNSVEVNKTFKPTARGFSGGLQITGIDSNYTQLFSLNEANVIAKPTTSKAKARNPNPRILPWLQWLLTFSDTGIIDGYDVEEGRGKGRSGLAIMVERENVWGVPSQFAGRSGDNFLTDAVKSLTSNNRGGELENIIKKRILEAL